MVVRDSVGSFVSFVHIRRILFTTGRGSVPSVTVYGWVHEIYVVVYIAHAPFSPSSSVPWCLSAATTRSPPSGGGMDMTDLTDACLPATHPHSNNRRDGWVPAFIRMLSNTMALDEAYPTKQVWWFLDIRTYVPVLCAVVYYPDGLGTCYYPVLIPVPFSCVRPREAIWVGTQLLRICDTGGW